MKLSISKIGCYVLLAVAVCTMGSAFAQNKKIDPNKAVEWTFKEKVKLTPEMIQKIIKENPEAVAKMKKAGKAVNSADVPISSITDPESEVHAAINPADSTNIVASPINMNSSAGISCPIYYTKDFGTTWQKSTFKNMPHVSTAISGGGGDPVFAYDTDGKLYFSWIDLYGAQMDFLFGTVNMGIFWAYSSDGGATWVEPTHDTILLGQMQMMMGSPSSIVSPISDKQWMAVDHSNSQYRNNLYVSYVTIGQTGQTSTYQIKCKTKPANQDRFTTEAAVTLPANFPFVQFSSLDVDHQGNVHVIFYGTNDGTTTSLWHSVSVDGGATFSTPNKISDVRYNLQAMQITPYDSIPGVQGTRNYPSPYMAADKLNGNLYVTWTAFGITSNLGNGSDVYFSRSTDNGTTWSTPLVVNNDPTGTGIHNYYSSIFVDETGRICISFYDRRGGAGNLNTDYYIATSTDGGLTFPVNTKVTSASMNFAQIGANNQGFGIGEYTQVLATPTGYNTIPVWSDGRENNGDVDTYIAFINPTTVGVDNLTTINENFSFSGINPNPVTSVAQINFELKKDAKVKVSVVDVLGKTLFVITDKNYVAGKNSLQLDGKKLSKGQYFCKMETSFGSAIKMFNVQ